METVDVMLLLWIVICSGLAIVAIRILVLGKPF